jgi:hypothetical protein
MVLHDGRIFDGRRLTSFADRSADRSRLPIEGTPHLVPVRYR